MDFHIWILIASVVTIFYPILPAAPQNKRVEVRFIVVTPSLPKNSPVYITGDKPDLGNWQPSEVKMERVNDSTWAKTFHFKKGDKIQYKFTLGTWKSEALTQNGSVPPNSILTINNDTTVVSHIDKWKSRVASAVNHKIAGIVEYFQSVGGKVIRPRDVIVWLPPSYTTDKKKRYPVLYMQDGQNLFDPSTSFAGVDWQLDEAADSLIKVRAIKEIIIVGIYNTPDRTLEYNDTKLGHAYTKFAVNRLKPFIDRKFRTLRGRGNTAVGGSSMGALISLMLAWDYSKIFSKVVCLSPAFHVDNIDYVARVKGYEGPRKRLSIYVDVGTKELDSLLEPGAKEMVNVLRQKVYDPGKELEFYVADGAAHNEAAWSKRNWRYLEFLFGAK